MAGSSTTSSSRGSTYESGSTAPRSTTTGCGIGSVCSGRSPSRACERAQTSRSFRWLVLCDQDSSPWLLSELEAESVVEVLRMGEWAVRSACRDDRPPLAPRRSSGDHPPRQRRCARNRLRRTGPTARPSTQRWLHPLPQRPLLQQGLLHRGGDDLNAFVTRVESAHQPEPCASSHTSRSHDTAPSCSTGIGCGSKWCTTATPTTMCVARSPAPTGCSGRPHAARRGRRAGRIIEQRVLLGTRGRTPRLRRSTRRGDGRRRVGSRS